MLSHYRYSTRSGLLADGGGSRLAMATNQLGEAAFFRGVLAQPLVAREALASLWSVVTSDLKWRPKPRLAFHAWLEQQDRSFVAEFASRRLKQLGEMSQTIQRLAELDAARSARRSEFEAARLRYLSYAAKNEIEAMRILDPVITVHPDEISFEAFSRDQSSYARLGIRQELFAQVEAFECGTTNIDFSASLHQHLDRLRSYRPTRFDITAGGFSSARAQAQPGDPVVHEKKIELPEGWVQGFLNVHGLMAMALTRVRLAPIDLLNVIRLLQQRKAKTSPRSLRFELRPGQPARMVVEPFGISLSGSPCSEYQEPDWMTVRVWGRDRLKTLARVLPVSRHVDVYLAANGLPSVWVCPLLDGSVFTLALSGWTDNDWVEGEARFDLLSRRATLAASELERVHQVLRQHRHLGFEQLASQTGLTLEQARSGVSLLCQSGRAMLDLAVDRPRYRDLLGTPFNASAAIKLAARSESNDPQAKAAQAIVAAGAIRIIARRPVPDGFKLSGNSAAESGGARLRPQLHISTEGQIISASCTCDHMVRNGMAKGACEHVLALRLMHLELP